MFFIFFPSLFLAFCSAATVDVNINSGPVNATVRGNELTNGYIFYGVPYAKPPVGDLRFEVSDPTGLIEATRGKAACIQHSTGTVEDCLYINIMTPKNITSSSSFPTFVWIHGGALITGSNGLPTSAYQNLINRGPMVIVSIAYRLGAFGFFSTRTSVVPGNMGLSDQITALEWVQKYIRFFGGNPNKVTIGGCSAGGWSVSAITMTRVADSVWHQSIHESGSIFDAAVMSYDETTRDSSKELAINAGCASADQWTGKQDAVMRQIVTCLKNKTGAEILAADTGSGWKWGYVQDTKFYPDRLEKIALTRRPKPAMVGVSHDELMASVQDAIDAGRLNSFTANSTISTIQHSHDMVFWNNKDQVIAGAIQQYVTSTNWTWNDHVNWAATYSRLWSEVKFIGPARRDANYLFKTGSKVYLYSFDFVSTMAQSNFTDPRLRGVEHGSELQYVFGTPKYNTPDDMTTYDLFGKLWTNFILYGNPTPSSGGIPTGFSWPEIGTNNAFASLKPRPTVGQDFHPSSKFWACTAPQIDGHPNPYC